MTTVLQRQLAVIASKTTHQLDLKAKKAAHGKSLLFEPKVAVSQDFNTLYQICLEGFEELCALDPRFSVYSSSIFSEQSKTEEREQMTADENQKLDSVLETFLGLVGARLLLKPAQKTVEWLVRRFRVHEYNVESLILAFLPYHSTPLFLSLLSILPRQLPQSFRFLYSSITVMQNPPLHTILYTATNNQAFFSAFNQFVLRVSKLRHHSSTLLSFWVCVTTQAVDGMITAAQSGRETIQRQRQEDLMLKILPILNQALNLRDVTELITGTCVITTVLAARANLENHVLDSMMEALATGWTPSTTDVRIISLGLLAQERTVAQLSRDVIKKLMKFEDFPARLLSISQKYTVNRLALGYILGCFKRLMRKGGENFQIESIYQVLNADLFGTAELGLIVKGLLSTTRKLRERGSISSEQRSGLAKVFTTLAKSPSSADIFQRHLERIELNQDELESFLEVIIPCLIDAPSPELDVIMNDIQPETMDADFDAAISAIAEKEPFQISFLSPAMASDFDLLYAVFLRSLSSEQNLQRFIQLPALDSQKSTAFASFFVRIWSGPFPQRIRCASLRVMTSALRAAMKGRTDYHPVIPYLIASLMDTSKQVRQAAAECFLALNHYYSSLGSFKLADLNTITLEGAKGFGAVAEEAQLDPVAIIELVQKTLLPDLEECILDANVVSTVLIRALDGNSRTKQTALKASEPDLKLSRRIFIVAFLAHHAVSSPVLLVRLRLLPVLNQVGKIGSSARTNALIPALKQWLVLTTEQFSYFCDNQHTSLPVLDQEFFRVLSPREKDGIQLLTRIITGEQPVVRNELCEAAHQRLGEIWPSVKAGDRETLALALLEAALSTSDGLSTASDGTSPASPRDLAMESLRNLILPTNVLVALVESLPSAFQMPEQRPAHKRRRTSRSEMALFAPADTTELSLALRRYTVVLELVESSNPADHPELLKGLFQVLGEIHDYRAQTNSGIVYLQGLAIHSLLAIVDKLKDTNAITEQKTIIRMDLLVDGVRHTKNPQVQNAALLLISCLAAWVPDLVLHSVMPIFTFMGTTILRQGDEYSAHVIDQTVSRIIPPLVASLRMKSKNIVQGASEILLSFTAAFEHIPLSRRLGLFQNVARTLGPRDCLYAIVAMIVDRYPTDTRARRFVAELVNSFDPSINLVAIRQYIGLVADIFKHRRSLSDTLLNLKDKPVDQLEAVAANLLGALADLLEDPALRSDFVASFHHNQALAAAQRKSFAELMQETIRLSQFLTTRRTLSQSSGRVMSNIFKLLPTVNLIECAESLLEQNEDELRHVVLLSIESQIRFMKHADSESATAVLEFVPRLTNLIQSSKNVPLRHSAIVCVDQIAEHFGKKDKTCLSQAARVILGDSGLGDSDESLKVVSMLCLATMVDALQEDFIPLIPNVLPQTFDYLRASLLANTSKSRVNVANAAFALINTTAEHLAFMLTGDYLDTALQLVQESAAAELCPVNRRQFYRLIEQNAEPSELFSAFNRNYTTSLQMKGYETVNEYFEALKSIVVGQSKSIVKRNSPALFELFIKAFDHRRVLASEDSSPGSQTPHDSVEMDRIEAVYNDVAIAMILKLDDTTFRPFFIRLVEWAASLPKKDFKGRMIRATMLFKFLTAVFGRLKSLATSYTSYILEFTAGVLRTTSPATEDGTRLLVAALAGLEQSFEHDQDDFWQSPNHFTPIAQPLVRLLETSASPTLTAATITTITSLASATSSSDQHKELNTSILKMMQSDDANARLGAVKAERDLIDKLGEDWLAMLPEMLPFLAELLEDDDENVEREAKACIKRVEDVMGEELEL